MTGGRPRRERGPQRGDPAPAQPRWTGTGGAELEELHVATLAPRGRARISMGTAVGALALVCLLAVGFGAFGGRPQASTLPVWSAAAASDNLVLFSDAVVPMGPRVTPFEPCAVERNSLPHVLLEVGDAAHEGSIEVLDFTPDSLPVDVPTAGPIETVDIAVGDGTAIRIDGARCALAWVIDFDGTTTIDVLANGDMDPIRAAQNRFELPLGDNPGRESLLRAQLLFAGFSIRASWGVKVARTEHPTAEVHWLDDDPQTEADIRTAAEGCFVLIQYDSGWREPDHACSDDEPILDAEPVNRTAAFRFFLGQWMVSLTGITCGHGVDATFVPDDAGCGWTFDDVTSVVSVEFPASFAKGPWTLAIDGCGYNGPVFGQLCGTWYTGVRLR